MAQGAGRSCAHDLIIKAPQFLRYNSCRELASLRPQQSSVGRACTPTAQLCTPWASASERTSVRHPAQLVGLAGGLAGGGGGCIARRRAQHGRLGHAEARPGTFTREV